GVDEHRVRLHGPQLLGAHETGRLGARRDMEADDVGAAEELSELDPGRIELAFRVRLRRAARVQDLAREWGDELGVAAADAAQPDDAERRSAQLLPEQRPGVPPSPPARP